MSGHAAGKLQSSDLLGQRLLGLWHSLVKVRMRDLVTRSQLGPSDRARLQRRAGTPQPYPLTADLAGVLALERPQPKGRRPAG